MEEIKSPTFSLSTEFESRIQKTYEKLFSINPGSDPGLSHAITLAHKYYIENPEASSPWHRDWFQKAYLAYYLPLNYLRIKGVLHRLKGQSFLEEKLNITEWGSGNGAFSLAFKETDWQADFQFIEQGGAAKKQHELLEGKSLKFIEDIKSAKSFDFFVASYSFTELTKLPDFVWDFDRLLLIEPSTNQDGRRLMSYRQNFIDEAYNVLAPCTHQGTCPLLKESEKDWCHDSFQMDYPEYLLSIENKIPVRLGPLSVSYLLVSKKDENPHLGKLRVTGNTLKERGKVRQMICRGEDREFLSWFPKRAPVPFISRGELLELEDGFQKKSNEIRGQVKAPE